MKLQVSLKRSPNVTFTYPFSDIETELGHSSEMISGKHKSVNNKAVKAEHKHAAKFI